MSEAKFVAMGAAIEGEKFGLQSRKLDIGLPMEHPRTKKLVHRFRLGIDSSASVSEAYENPAERIAYENSQVAEGSALEAPVIAGWSCKPMKEPHITKGSGSHSAATLSIKGGCFAQIDQIYRHYADDPTFESRNPPVVLKLLEVKSDPTSEQDNAGSS